MRKLTPMKEQQSLSMRAKLARAIAASGSHVCVGLDPDPARMPVADVAEFNLAIVDATHDLVAAYKPQFAFYEALGIPGMRALDATVRHIRDVAPDAFLLADAKRGDIAHTGQAYAKAVFDVMDFDAVTVSPYIGAEAIAPFLGHPGRGAFVLCWTSNPGGAAVQEIRDAAGQPVYQRVAELAHSLGDGENVGLVVAPSRGADGVLSDTNVLAGLAARYPSTPILIPGVGAQGGSAEDCARVGGAHFLINSSRGIIYAGDEPSTFGQRARDAVQAMRDAITRGAGSARSS